MARHAAVTIRATVRATAGAALDAALVSVRRRGPADPDLPLAELAGLHFARIFVLPDAHDLAGRPLPASLVYMADVDGTADDHLRELAERAAVGVDTLFSHCEGYPAEPDTRQRHTWLTRHSLTPAAYYIHTVGRSVDRIRAEGRLRVELETLADDPELVRAGTDPLAVKQRLVDAVRVRPDLAWATKRDPGVGLARAVLDAALVIGLAALAVATLPILLPALALWLVAIRLRELTEQPETGTPDPAHVRRVLEYEDHAAQNPFTAVGLVRPGRIRPVTMRVALAGLEFANRHLFRRDNLAGVRTIHFARWLPLDDGRRLVFASSYDGSLESYMDDFIDRLRWGINLVFSNGEGFPRTRWLVLDGAGDELAYKQYLRRHQIPTVVFYSAYPKLTARAADDNAQLRHDLQAAADRDAAAAWLALL